MQADAKIRVKATNQSVKDKHGSESNLCVTRSNSSYRLEQRVSLEELWVSGLEGKGTMEDIDLGVTLILAWGLHLCLAGFR